MSRQPENKHYNRRAKKHLQASICRPWRAALQCLEGLPFRTGECSAWLQITAVPTPKLWVVVVAALPLGPRKTRRKIRRASLPVLLAPSRHSLLVSLAHQQRTNKGSAIPTKYRVALPITPVIWVVSWCFPLGLAKGCGRGKHPAPFFCYCYLMGFWGAVPPPPAGGSPSTTSLSSCQGG